MFREGSVPSVFDEGSRGFFLGRDSDTGGGVDFLVLASGSGDSDREEVGCFLKDFLAFFYGGVGAVTHTLGGHPKPKRLSIKTKQQIYKMTLTKYMSGPSSGE